MPKIKDWRERNNSNIVAKETGLFRLLNIEEGERSCVTHKLLTRIRNNALLIARYVYLNN